MKNTDEITKELQSLDAGILSGHFGAVQVFQVPEHFFAQFPDQVMNIIRFQDDDTTFQTQADKTGPYAVPPTYFDTLAGNILLQVKAMDMITERNALPWQDAEKKNPFQVPPAYFETLEDEIWAKIYPEQDAAGEIEAMSPLLASLRKENAFTVPDQYFQAAHIVQLAKQQELKTKTVQHPAVKSITWARWAAAAAVMAIFTLGGLHFLTGNSGTADTASFQESLAKIPDAKIKDWLASNMDESDINNLGSSISNINTITPKRSVSDQTRSSLSDFSDKELKDYLETEVW